MKTLAGAAASLVLGALLAGCGGGVGSLTGGSIPVGEGKLSGQVAQASDPSQPVAGAKVSVVDAASRAQEQQTDAQGKFAFSNLASGSVHVRVDPPEGLSLSSFECDVSITDTAFASLGIVLSPGVVVSGPPVAVAAGNEALTIDPLEPQLKVGDSLQFAAKLSSTSEAVTATWIVEGGIGSVTPTGLFTATNPGSGTVRAIWGGISSATSVRVSL